MYIIIGPEAGYLPLTHEDGEVMIFEKRQEAEKYREKEDAFGKWIIVDVGNDANGKKESVPANTNCLEGIRCPECGQTDRFEIVGTAVFDVTDDGTDNFHNVEWDNESSTCCPDCGHRGKLDEFRT